MDRINLEGRECAPCLLKREFGNSTEGLAIAVFATTVARSSGLAANASSLVTIKDGEIKGTDDGQFQGYPVRLGRTHTKSGPTSYFFIFIRTRAQREKLPGAPGATYGAAFAFDAVSIRDGHQPQR